MQRARVCCWRRHTRVQHGTMAPSWAPPCMLGLPQLPCGPLVTLTIWQRSTACPGALIAAYRILEVPYSRTSSALIPLPSTEASIPAQADTACGLSDDVQSQAHRLRKIVRAAEPQNAAGWLLAVRPETARGRARRTTSLSVVQSPGGLCSYCRCALFLCCGGQCQSTLQYVRTCSRPQRGSGGWRIPEVIRHARSLLTAPALPSGPMSNVTSPCSQQLTDSIALGHATAVREHAP